MPNLIDGLVEILDSKTVKLEYGIDDSVVVCPFTEVPSSLHF